MAGDSDVPKFTGLAKYFNSYTNDGRANTAKLTYAVFAMIGIYFYMKPKKQPAAAVQK